jgi:hypothetical protein
MANALLEVCTTFTTLDAQYNLLRAACKPGPDPDQPSPDLVALDEKYTTAQENCYAAADKVLQDDNEAVARISQDLQAVNTELGKAVTEMGDISKVLDTITQALAFGSQLLALVP